MKEAQTLSREFGVPQASAVNLITLLDQGNTVPFIARYRKEATGSMDDQLIRRISERLADLRTLEERRAAIESTLEGLGVLTDEIKHALSEAASLGQLEDIYRPYRPRRRTRAGAAKERGLEPLAQALLAEKRDLDVNALAQDFVFPDREVPDAESALKGARDIIAEMVSDDARMRSLARAFLLREGQLVCRAAGEQDSVYRTYYDFSGSAASMPAHRILAIDRGEKEGFLSASIVVNEDRILPGLLAAWVKDGPAAQQVRMACMDAWKRLLFPAAERELRSAMTQRAQESAVCVFQDNLRALLMQRPVRGQTVLGVDPGFRTGCKLAVVDRMGRVIDQGVGHFTLPGNEAGKEKARRDLLDMIDRNGVTAIAIGNGTASREAETFIASVIENRPAVGYVLVSEAGASVYSASELAARELGAYDVTIRGAVSIARRLQDPMAELVKIDPKALGVGQYQHDLKETRLSEALDGVVEDCVNSVGVEIGQASVELLRYVAGVGPSLAQAIIAYRDEKGIACREDLKKVPRLGEKAFRQCAGFLRVVDSPEPLDHTGVHPESYRAARKLMSVLGYDGNRLVGGALTDLSERAARTGMENLAELIGVGLPTLKDIVNDLSRPGRDPRDSLPPPVLRRDVLSMHDLKPGMELKGTVRNVADFGAFVDIGVHQDGLVHISRIAERFIRHPSQVLTVGDVVDVWVVDVDEKQNRIALSMIKDKT